MRGRRVILPILLLVVVGVSAFFVLRARGDEENGPPIALCPGPDAYGYRCEAGAVFPYIDATNDTFLYSDDGTVVVALPFPFTFYGSSYQQVVLSSNGTLQFTTENAAFSNGCLNEGPVAGMGEMIAPFWDDLDLTFVGFLETAVVGEAGSRIFVIEWDDVPAFGAPDDRVTFEVQLFEGSNDIVFLYQDVNRAQGGNGRSATIGLQSEIRGNTLQFGCNQLSVTNGLTVHFPHPADAAQEIGRPSLPQFGSAKPDIVPKGDLKVLLERLNQDGINSLQGMRLYFLAQQPQREMVSVQADVIGDEREELVLMLRPPVAFAEHTELVVFGLTGEEDEDWELIYQRYPLARQGDNVVYYSVENSADLLKLLPPSLKD